MATSIFGPPAIVQACSALGDNLGRKPVSTATGPNRAAKPEDETASTRGARIVVTGKAIEVLSRGARCKTLAVAAVTLRLRANSRRTANVLSTSERQKSDGSNGIVTAEIPSHAPLIGAETIQAAVLFADMRGYTGLAEQLPPAQVVSILTEFFALLARVTVTFSGQVFHMAGDGMMAGFGIRDSRRSGARAALTAGHAMLRHFAPIERRWRAEFAVITGIGIGIHVGEVALGFLGPPGKEAITMIGDTANVAARLCSSARAGEVLFSSAIAVALVDDGGVPATGRKPFLLPQSELRGRSELLDIWCMPAPGRRSPLTTVRDVRR
jgi:class 3 adenylate cyclase